MDRPETILVTGAAGIVGTALRPILRDTYQSVVLSDIEPVTDPADNETYIECDLTDLEKLKDITKAVGGIVHLGGMVGADYTFDEVLGPNIIGTHNLFEAARINRVPRIVYATSHHAVGFTPRGQKIDHRTAPRPNGEYGVSKACGEAMASYFVDNFDMEILSIRIGYVGDDVSTERRLYTWISPRDLVQLIEIGFTIPGLGHEIVYGISESPDPGFFDNSNAYRLGYRPSDKSLDQLSDPTVLEYRPDLSSIAEGVIGGGFASAGFQGDPKKVLKRGD